MEYVGVCWTNAQLELLRPWWHVHLKEGRLMFMTEQRLDITTTFKTALKTHLKKVAYSTV